MAASEAELEAEVAALLERCAELEGRLDAIEGGGENASENGSSSSSSSAAAARRSRSRSRPRAVARKPLYVEPAAAGTARKRREERRRARAEEEARWKHRSKSPWKPRTRQTKVVSSNAGAADAAEKAKKRPLRPKTPRAPDGALVNPGDLLPPPAVAAANEDLHESADRFGAVYRARYKGRDVAVKVFNVTKQHLGPAEVTAFRREVAQMTRISHDNVVSTVGYCLEPLCVVTDWLDSRTLLDVLVPGAAGKGAGGNDGGDNNEEEEEDNDDDKSGASAAPLPWPQRYVIAKDLAAGMRFLHESKPPVLHRYLAPERVLVATTAAESVFGRVMLGGFGLSRVKAAMELMDEQVPLAEETAWQAPELLAEDSDGKYTAATDMYAFGVILYSLAARAVPWPGLSSADIVRRVRSGERPPIRRQPCSADYAEMVEYCWHADPRKRPTFKQVLGTLEELAKRPVTPAFLLGAGGQDDDEEEEQQQQQQHKEEEEEQTEEPPKLDRQQEADEGADSDGENPPPPPLAAAGSADPAPEKEKETVPPPPSSPHPDEAGAPGDGGDEWDVSAMPSRGRARSMGMGGPDGSQPEVVVSDDVNAAGETRQARTTSVASSWGFDLSPSSLEQLLERDSFTLEEVMADDDCMTEVKMLNFKLVDFLAALPNARALCRYAVDLPGEVTAPSSVGAAEKARYRSAYVATELLAAENQQIMDAVLGDDEALSALFSVLERPAPVNPAAAVYLHRVAQSLIHRNYARLVRFVRSRPGLTDAMVRHIGEGAVMQLLEMLGWENEVGAGVVDLQWLYKAGLVPRLVERLGAAESTPAARANASQTLCDIVRKTAAGAGTGGDFLVAHLQSGPVVDSLLGLLRDDPAGPCAEHVLPVVVVLVAKAVGDADDAEDSEDEGSVGGGSGDGDDGGGRAYSSPFVDRLAKATPALGALVADGGAGSADAVELSTGALESPVGRARLLAVRAVAAMAAANFRSTNAAMHEARLVPACVDLFFRYEWNNMLHTEVVRMLYALLEESGSADLKRSVFEEGALVDRLLEAHEEAEHERQKRRPRVAGNAGHVMRVCSVLSQVGDPLVRGYLDAHEDWESFVGGGLAAYQERLSTVIGDRRPSSPQQYVRRR